MRRLATDSLLRNRDFASVVASVGLSALGDFVALYPLILHVQEMTDSGLAVAALLIALWGPAVVLAGPAGLIVDRFESTRLLGFVSLAQAAIVVVLAFSNASLFTVLPLTVLLGIGIAVSQPAEFALIPAITRDQRLVEANGFVESARYAGLAVGPVLGGLLVAVGGVRLGLLVDAVSFVAVAAIAFTLRVRRRPRAAGTPAEHSERAREGFVFIGRDRVLALTIGVATASLVFMSISIPAEVFFIRETLDGGAFGYGALLSTWMAGMLLGALTIAKRIAPAVMVTGVLVAVTLQGASKVVPSALVLLWMMFPGYLIGGAAQGVRNTLTRALVQQRTPDELRGRAFAAYNALRNGAELGALTIGGTLVVVIGARSSMLVAGGGCALAGLAGLLWRMRAPAIDAPAEQPI